MKDNNDFDYQVFSKEELDKQFDEIVKTIDPNWNHDKIMTEVHKILVNRIMLASIYDKDSPTITLYRVTPMYKGFNSEEKLCYSYPLNPNMGRANIKGFPVLYTSLSPRSAVDEMKGSLKENEWFFISKWKFSFPRELRIHSLILNTIDQDEDDILNSLKNQIRDTLSNMVKTIPKKFQKGFVYAVQKMGELYATPNNDLYHITSAYSHEILYKLRDMKMFMPAIVYPSVESNHTSINFAMHPSLADSQFMELEQVFKVCINKRNRNKDAISTSISQRGIFKDNKFLKWESPHYQIVKIVYSDLELNFYNETIMKGDATLPLKINNSELTVGDKIKSLIEHEDFIHALSQIPINEEDEESLSIDSKVNNFTAFFEFNHGIEVETVNGMSCISKLSIPVIWKLEYR